MIPSRASVIRRFLAYFSLAILIVGVGALFDFPKAHIDDIFFVQTAVGLRSFGFLCNPTFSFEFSEGLTPERNFGQSPFYSFLISLWLDCFGLSTRSLQLFFLSFMGLGIFSLFWLSDFFKVRKIFVFPATCIFFSSLSLFGLRPEVPSLCLFLLSWVLFSFKGYAAFFAALGVLGLSAAIYPSGLMFGGPLFCYFFFRDFWPIGARLGIKAFFPVLASLVWICFFLFCLDFLIKDNWSNFWRDFSRSAALQNPGLPFSLDKFRLAWFMGTTGSLFFPKGFFVVFSFLFASLLYFWSFKYQAARECANACMILSLGILLNAGFVPLKFRLFSSCSVIIAAWSLSQLFDLFKSRQAKSLCFLFFLPYLLLAIPAFVYAFVQSAPASFSLERLVSDLQLKGYQVLVDSNTAKYGLNWKLPPKTIDFHCSRKFLETDPVLRIKPSSFDKFYPHEIAILSWNDSLIPLSGKRLSTEVGPFSFPVPPSKASLFITTKDGVLGPIEIFDISRLPEVK